MKVEDEIRIYKDIEKDYQSITDIFSLEEEKVATIKDIINNKLSAPDKIIILLYIDCLSYRKLGQRLGVSHMTIRKEVRRIKHTILDEYYNSIS